MPSFSTICATALAVLSTCATFSQAYAIDKRDVSDLTSSPMEWSGVLSNGTSVKLSGTIQSIMAQVKGMDPNYKPSQSVAKRNSQSLSKRDTIYCYPNGVGTTSDSTLVALANDLSAAGGTCTIAPGGTVIYDGNPGSGLGNSCISWYNEDANNGWSVACSELGSLVVEGANTCNAAANGGQVAVSIDEGSGNQWYLVGGAC